MEILDNNLKQDIEWSLYGQLPGTDKPILLSPLDWKGGDQLSNLKEMLEFILSSDMPDKIKILIYRSFCGSGKSATLLNLCKEMDVYNRESGPAIIVVPFKNLQRQYFEDYFRGNKFVLKKDGIKLKVTVILGRNNFQCKWLSEEYEKQQKIIEANKKLVGHQMHVDDNILKTYQIDTSCANKFLPCTKILKSIGKGRRESRWSTASVCPYWVFTPISADIIKAWEQKEEKDEDIDDFYEEDFLSPYRKLLNVDENATEEQINIAYRKLALRYDNKSAWAEERLKEISRARDLLTGKDQPTNTEKLLNTPIPKEKKGHTRLDTIKDTISAHKIRYYESVSGEEYGIFIRDEKDKNGNPCQPTCPYYQQFYSYTDSDVIVMNDAKWSLETRIGRKPKGKVEIFDEGDYFLDKQATTIEIKRTTIDRMLAYDQKMRDLKTETLYIFDTYFKKLKTEVDNAKDGNIVSSGEYKELFDKMAKCVVEYIRHTDDIEALEERLIELSVILRYINKASLSYIQGKRDETKIINVYIPYPDNLLKELFKRSSNNIIITSGTIHTNFVLSSLFGINVDNYNVKILDGRRDSPGRLTCIKPKDGMLKVSYTNWQSPVFKEFYNRTLNYILDKLKITVDKYTSKPGEAKIVILTPAKKYAEGILNRDDVFIDFAKNRSQGEEINKKMINTNLSNYVDNMLEDVRKIQPTDIELEGDVLRTNQQIIVSTRMIRGADLRDNLCRGLVMLKWPTPDISDGYYQALKKRFGESVFWAIVKDKAEREAVQYVSRGLRHDRDWVYFSSPDEFAFNRIYTIFREMKQ